MFLNGRISVVVGDITRLRADAIVNAANGSLLGGGGVDGAIHSAAGPELNAACQRLRAETYPNGLPTGEAALTGAGRLPARAVIHTVGPVYGNHGGNESKLLASCYTHSLILARDHGFERIAFPAISTGIYGYPKAEAARIAFRTVRAFLNENHTPRTVIFVFFTAADSQIFLNEIRK
ncbi:MAG TPA: O-acetyl-ADP-ribose deacetylase [Spirochaetia bacterium]|nr:O-acetyl-ADP-ribose deacetylase [Spirochaetia bacterium]